jgi:hypothetical protein
LPLKITKDYENVYADNCLFLESTFKLPAKFKQMKIGNRPEIYKRTVDILFDAYFNDTLQHSNCCACAVGNIVAARCGFKLQALPNSYGDRVVTWGGAHTPAWDDVFMTAYGKQFTWFDNYTDEAKTQIDSTGFIVAELAKIEYAFETANKGTSSEDWMFNGLVAVLEVLKEIHEVTEDEESAQRFKAHYESKQLNS